MSKHKRTKPNKPKWDNAMMDRLLQEPGVAEKVAQMTPLEKDMYKDLLYKMGIYQRYAIEQQNKALKDAWKGGGK